MLPRSPAVGGNHRFLHYPPSQPMLSDPWYFRRCTATAMRVTYGRMRCRPMLCTPVYRYSGVFDWCSPLINWRRLTICRRTHRPRYTQANSATTDWRKSGRLISYYCLCAVDSDVRVMHFFSDSSDSLPEVCLILCTCSVSFLASKTSGAILGPTEMRVCVCVCVMGRGQRHEVYVMSSFIVVIYYTTSGTTAPVVYGTL